jgi:3-oxoacyl-[acyl-carrier protein] reductase
MFMNLKDKIAVITGAGSGLGAALSKNLVSRGATVFGIGRTTPNLGRLRGQLGPKFIPVPLDITNEPRVTEWVETTFSSTINPSVLINNAATGYFAPLNTLTTEQWNSMINTNLSGTFYITRKIVPLMRARPDVCHILNVGSVLGKTTRSDATAYCATKYGLQGFIEATENMLQPEDLADFVASILETPDNFLIDELTIRPLSRIQVSSPDHPTNNFPGTSNENHQDKEDLRTSIRPRRLSNTR